MTPLPSPAVGIISLAITAIAVAYATAFLPGGAPTWAAWVVGWGTMTLIAALIWLGARRPDGSHRILRGPLVLTWLILVLSLGLVLALPAEADGASALVLGLPRRAALVLYGLGLLPALVLPLTYLRTFDHLTLRPDDLARIRALRRPEDAP